MLDALLGEGRRVRSKVSAERAKRALLVIAGVRTFLSALALPLAPFLFREHFLVLVLLRPSQGLLLIGAILARHGDVNLLALIAAALPLQLLVIWLYFALGQRWEEEINSDAELPFFVTRLLQPEQIRRLRKVVRKRGWRFVVLSRFALFPTGLLAATAGASDLAPRRFFVADAAALSVAMGAVVTLGYGLGFAQHRAEVWIVSAGIVGLLALTGALTFYLWRASS